MIKRRVHIVQHTPETIQLEVIAPDCSNCKNKCLFVQNFSALPNFFIPGVLYNAQCATGHSTRVPQEGFAMIAKRDLVRIVLRYYGLPLVALFAASFGMMFIGCNDMLCAVAGFGALFMCQFYYSRKMARSITKLMSVTLLRN